MTFQAKFWSIISTVFARCHPGSLLWLRLYGHEQDSIIPLGVAVRKNICSRACAVRKNICSRACLDAIRKTMWPQWQSKWITAEYSTQTRHIKQNQSSTITTTFKIHVIAKRKESDLSGRETRKFTQSMTLNAIDKKCDSNGSVSFSHYSWETCQRIQFFLPFLRKDTPLHLNNQLRLHCWCLDQCSVFPLNKTLLKNHAHLWEFLPRYIKFTSYRYRGSFTMGSTFQSMETALKKVLKHGQHFFFR